MASRTAEPFMPESGIWACSGCGEKTLSEGET